jgi:hypothetical protein
MNRQMKPAREQIPVSMDNSVSKTLDSNPGNDKI